MYLIYKKTKNQAICKKEIHKIINNKEISSKIRILKIMNLILMDYNKMTNKLIQNNLKKRKKRCNSIMINNNNFITNSI